MKISIKRKSLRIIILFIIFIVISVSFFSINKYYLDSGKLSVNRYGDIVSNCSQEMSPLGISFRCTALLNRYEIKNGKEECFSLSLVGRDNRLQQTTLCEDYGYVDFTRSEMITEKVVPIYIDFIYKGLPLTGYSIDDIRFFLLTDEEIFYLFEKIFPNGVPNMNVRGNIEEEVKKTGYYRSNDLVLDNGKKIKRVFFYLGEILNTEVNGSNMVFEIKLNINRNEYLTKVYSERIAIEKEMAYSVPELNVSNFHNYDISGETQVMFFYLDKNSAVTNEDIIDYCDKNDKEFDSISLCNIVKERDISDFEINDLDSYISSTVKGSENGNIYFDELIFGYLLLKP